MFMEIMLISNMFIVRYTEGVYTCSSMFPFFLSFPLYLVKCRIFTQSFCKTFESFICDIILAMMKLL